MVNNTGMEISASDAFLIFDKWRSENTRVILRVSCIGWDALLKGKIREASSSEILFEAPSVAVRVSLDLGDLLFLYGEMPEAKGTSGLAIALPLRIFPGQTAESFIISGTLPTREKLVFAEEVSDARGESI